MERLQIKIPKTTPLAHLRIPVRITDLNYGNHLGNDSVVSILHEARVQFLHAHGLSELDIGGIGLIMSDLALNFKNESFYGDVLKVALFGANVSKVSFKLIYEVRTSRDGRTLAIAHGQTTMVAFNYQTRKVTALPEEIKKILEVK